MQTGAPHPPRTECMPCRSESVCGERSGGRWSGRVRLSECFPVPVVTYPWTLKDSGGWPLPLLNIRLEFIHLHSLGCHPMIRVTLGTYRPWMQIIQDFTGITAPGDLSKGIDPRLGHPM